MTCSYQWSTDDFSTGPLPHQCGEVTDHDLPHRCDTCCAFFPKPVEIDFEEELDKALARIKELEADIELLKGASGWNRYFDTKAQPLKAKADAWDSLRTDMQQLDTPCRQWVEGLMVDLIDE